MRWADTSKICHLIGEILGGQGETWNGVYATYYVVMVCEGIRGAGDVFVRRWMSWTIFYSRYPSSFS